MIERWLPYLQDLNSMGSTLEILRFNSNADFAPFRGCEWGVLISRAGRMYPFCGPLVLFERTDEAATIFSRFEEELRDIAGTHSLRLPEAIQVGHGHSADGLFSSEQVTRYNQFLVNSPFWSALGELTFQDWERFVPNSADSLLLDLGCGTGRCTLHFAKSGHRVIAVDLSYSMIVSVLNSPDLNGCDCLFVMASAVSLPLRDGCVSAVTSFGTLHHIASPSQGLHEVSRVLASGGVFQALEPNKTPLRFVFDYAMRVLPMWEEEAGEENLFSPHDIRHWSKGLPMTWNFRYSIFLLPQLIGLLRNSRAIQRLIRVSDVLQTMPLIRVCAGLLIFRGRKQ